MKRTHQVTGQEVTIAATSCRMVSFETFEKEISDNDLLIVEKGITSINQHFPEIMYAVVKG